MPKHRRLILIILLSIGSIVTLLSYLNRPQPINVAVHTLSRGEVLSSVANTRAGTLKACRRARLSPSIGGQIEHLPVTEGDRVKRDDVLLEIWNDDLNAQLTLARGEASAAGSRACDAANTSIKVSQARIDVAIAALARTRLLAPFDGTVAEVNGELGEFLTPSPVGIATLPAIDLIDYTCLYVSAPIDEVDAPQIKTGMNANISLDAFAGTLFKGKIRRVASYVLEREKQARTVEVEVEFHNPTEAKKMLPGYSADVEVILQRRENVLRIPSEALMENQQVYVLLDDETIVKRPIKIGMRNWSFTEVLSGLEVGDRIVVSVEREGLEDGALVKISPQMNANGRK